MRERTIFFIVSIIKVRKTKSMRKLMANSTNYQRRRIRSRTIYFITTSVIINIHTIFHNRRINRRAMRPYSICCSTCRFSITCINHIHTTDITLTIISKLREIYICICCINCFGNQLPNSHITTASVVFTII